MSMIDRNNAIVGSYDSGMAVQRLAKKHHLTKDSIYKIIQKDKKKKAILAEKHKCLNGHSVNIDQLGLPKWLTRRLGEAEITVTNQLRDITWYSLRYNMKWKVAIIRRLREFLREYQVRYDPMIDAKLDMKYLHFKYNEYNKSYSPFTQFRAELGMTQYDFCQKLRLSRTTISDLEDGVINIPSVIYDIIDEDKMKILETEYNLFREQLLSNLKQNVIAKLRTASNE